MARLIDADALEEKMFYIEEKRGGNGWVISLEDLANAPTVDAAEVVRCKDCKHLTIYNSPELYAYCKKTHLRFEPFHEDTRTHFCSYGERKDND